MNGLQIAVESRDKTGKGVARKMRVQGRIPAVIYGAGVKEARAVSLATRDIVAVLNRTSGMNTIVTLKEGDTEIQAVIRDFQFHPISRAVLHCDFLAVTDDAPVLVDIPVRTIGKSKGEEAGARRYVAKREIRVKTLPADLPEEIVVDVTPLRDGEVMYVDQLTFPEGVVPIYRTRYPVVVIQKARAETDTRVDDDDAEEDAAEGAETPAE